MRLKNRPPDTSAGKNIGYSKRRVPVFAPRGHFETLFLATLYPNPLNERRAHSSATCCFYVPCAMRTILVNIQGRKTSTITTGLSCFFEVAFSCWRGCSSFHRTWKNYTNVYLMYSPEYKISCISKILEYIQCIIDLLESIIFSILLCAEKHKGYILPNFTER